MFFRKKSSIEPMLADFVNKTMDTGFVFWDINDDLGHSTEEIFKSTPHVIMSYAYARRGAAAALYIQGLLDKDGFSHVESIFKNLQQQTGHTVEFQERAAADSLVFMQGYHHSISSLFVKKVIQIAREYDVPLSRLSDVELFKNVIETLYIEEMQPDLQSQRQPLVDEVRQSLSEVQISAHRCAHSICVAIDDIEIIWQLILEDIEGASMGSEMSKAFARASGISVGEYTGALNHSRPEVDGPKGLKTFLDEAALKMLPNRDKVVEFRLAATDYIMKYFRLGQYADAGVDRVAGSNGALADNDLQL